MPCRRRHWLGAFAVAVLVHLGVALAVLWQAPPTGAVSAGVGGVEISLGAAGGSPGATAPATAVEDSPETPEPAAPPEATEGPEAPAPPTPVETAMAPAPEPPVETPAAEPEPTPLPEPVEAAAPVEAMPEPKPEPQPDPEPDPKPAPTVSTLPPPPPSPKQPPATPPEPPKQVAERPEPQAEARPEASPAPATAPETLAAVDPSAPGAGGRSGTENSADSGDGAGEAAGGAPGQIRDYMALLQAWLEKHKEYPRRARLRRQEGTALLYFVMDRHGRVLDFRVQRTSGHALLDQEVADMVVRAQPLPEMPENMQQARLEVVVPVQFQLR